jgi:hypothetical protein
MAEVILEEAKSEQALVGKMLEWKSYVRFLAEKWCTVMYSDDSADD